MESWTWDQVWRRRLARHHLLEPAPFERLTEVVGQVCGIHGQVAASAELSIGLRVSGVTRQHVRRALWEERSLVKTYGLRGTVHLFPTAELHLWLAALRAKPAPRPRNQDEETALPSDRIDDVLGAMRDALDGRQLTRAELGTEIAQRLGAWADEPVWPAFGGTMPRWQLALGRASTQGEIVFGPQQGSRVTYVRLDQWLGTLPAVDGQDALREVCRRFLDAYGPATHVEFARWFTTSPRAAKALIDSLDDELVQVNVDGWKAWLPASAGSADEPERYGQVHLLPHFDCYVVGGFPRDRLILDTCPPQMRKGTAAPFAVLLVDGRVGGLWKRVQRGGRFEVTVDPVQPLDSTQREQLERLAQRVGEILEAKVDFSFDYVEPRAHL